MSAFDLLTPKPLNELPAPAAGTTASPEPLGEEDASGSFREALSGADARSSETREPRETNVRETGEDRVEPAAESRDEATRSAETAESPKTPEASGEAVSEAPADEAVDSQNAVSTDEGGELSAEDESPVAELVLDLIAAFESVLENNPLTQTVDGVTAGNGESDTAFPGLTALYEALGAVSAITGGNSTPGATSAAGLPGGVTTPVAPPTLNVGNTSAGTTAAPIAPVTLETTLAQTSTDGDASGNQNNGNTNTPSGNTAANAALNPNSTGSLAVNANAAAAATPDLAVSNTANLNVTPLTNANPVGTDVSARLNPAGITDANAGNDALNAARLTRGLNNAVNQQGGSVTLRLTPPEMGTVRIQLNLQGTNVSAQFHAETDSAQRLLTQQLGQLRTSLESQGLNVERLGVQSMSASSNSSSLQQQTNSDNPQSQANADGRSRGNAGGNAGGQSSQQSGSGGDDADAASSNFTQLLDPDLEAEAGTLTAV